MSAQIDFYQLGSQSRAEVCALLAAKVRGAGERLLICGEDGGVLSAISDALWAAAPARFLANGHSDEPHSERQPILLSPQAAAPNGATMVVLADGQWREEALEFKRVFLIFGDAEVEGARALWRNMGSDSSVKRNYWKNEAGRWVQAA